MEKNEYSIIENYIFQNDIGEGNFGKVKLCIFKKTGEKFAIKIMNKKRIEIIMKNKIFRENKIITKFHHLNVISVFEIIEDLSNYYIIMEYCEKGELFEYILSHQKLTEDECSLFFYQLINGVGHIHSMGVAHRDLKPENILLTDKNILKIIDFGLSHEFNEKSELLNTKCGSPSYASPEIILGKEYDGFKSDIWSCGIILYAMATGYLPFEGENNKILFREILECNPDIPIYLSEEIIDLISSILTKNPDERISIENIKKHEFYLKGKKLFEKKYKNIFETKNYVKILNENEKKNLEKNTKENIIKNIVSKDYNIEEEEKSRENVEMNSNNKNSFHKIKNNKNNKESHKNKIKFINSKNTIITFKNKIMNINLNFNKKIESLNEKMNHILNTDANTIIANKINNNPVYFSIINNTESNQNKDTSNNNNNKNISCKANKYLETKINNIYNNKKQMEIKVKSKNKKSKLELHKRNKITNITPFLKTSETSPTSTKLPSFGRGDTSSEKVFSLKSNTRNSSSKHSTNINDTYRINSKSNNQRLNSQNNIDLINKFNYYLIGKKTIPKNKNSKRARIIGCKMKAFNSFKAHYSNNQIPFYNYKSNFTTTTNNSHSNNKENSSSDDNSQFKKLFTKYNNYNKKLIQKKKLLNKISLSEKNKSNNIIKNVRSIKSIHSSNDKFNSLKKENKNKIKTNKKNCKYKKEFNKLFKLNEETNKSNSKIIKSLINNNNCNKNNIQLKNLKKTICINNYIYKSNNFPISSSTNKYQNKNRSINNNLTNNKKSSIMHLMQKNFNNMKTRKSFLQINLSYFNKNNIKKKINKRNSQKFYTNNNTYVNSISSLSSANNSIKKMFYSKENISSKYMPSENGSECRYSNRNNKHGKDILLTKIKDILKRKNKDVNYFLHSLNSVKSYKKKSFSNFISRKGSSERSVKKINYSGLEYNNITVNSLYKYMSNYRNEITKKNKKNFNTNLNLKTLKNTPSDFLSLYKRKLISN